MTITTTGKQNLNAPKMRVTRTRRIAGQQNHLLGKVAEEQVYWVTYHEIPEEQWRKVMAIKRAEKQAEKRARGSQLGPPTNSV